MIAALLGASDSALARAGDLSFAACISGEDASTLAASGPCLASPTSSASTLPTQTPGDGSGLSYSVASAVSPDNRNVYVVAQVDDAIVRFSRNAVTGALSYRDCWSGDTDLVAACKLIPGSTPGGEGSGLDGPRSLAVSDNGRSVYVVSGESAVARFSRTASQGALSYSGCISGRTNISCAQIPSATPTPTGNGSGLGFPIEIVASPDGKSVYVSSIPDVAVARFDSDPTSGALAYAGCISGSTDLAPACALIPSATPSGEDSGLGTGTAGVERSKPGLAISPDGDDVYMTSAFDDSVARFDRNTTTGALSYAGCLSGERESACARIETATRFGERSGFDFPESIEISSDGRSAYVGSAPGAPGTRLSGVVVVFRRSASGALSFRGCVTGDSELGAPCDTIPSATPGGTNSGLDAPVGSLSVSPDGDNVYAAGGFGAAIARFDRNTATGAIRYAGCLGGDRRLPCDLVGSATPTGDNSGFFLLNSLSISSDGTTVYATSALDAAVVTFNREDLSSPALRLLGPTRQRSARRIAVEVSCDEPCRLVLESLGLATIAAKKKLKLKRAKADLEANETKKLKLKFKGKRTKRLVKRSLKRGKKITVRLQLTATDEGGNTKTKRLKVKLKR